MPLPSGVKFPPPVGYTGYNRKPVTSVEVEKWSDGYENLALGMPDNVIGIDVDTYRDKPGLDSIHAAEAAFGSELPATWISSSKDHRTSGIRFYRVPAGVDWSTVASVLGDAVADAPGVDIIRPTHRYAVVSPSVHPSGTAYTWVGPNGAPSSPPRVDELPMLPGPWLTGLTTRAASAMSGDPVSPEDRAAALAWMPTGRSEQVSKVLAAGLAKQDDPDGSHYDAMVADTYALVALGASGYAGTPEALEQLQARYSARVADSRSEVQAASEFWRAVDGAIGKLYHAAPEIQERVTSLVPVPAMDLDVADEYVNRFGDQVRYTSDLGKWFGYSEGRWDRVGGDSVARRRFQDMIRNLWAYELRHDKQGGTQRADATPWLRSASRITATLDHVRSNGQVQCLADEFNKMPMLFNCANGTVELVTGTLQPHDPRDMLTQRSDINYDPDAKCPEFVKFIGEALPDTEVRDFVQRLFGMALLGEVRDHVFTVFTGTGRNGKGVLLDVAQAVFGNYSTGIHKDLLVQTTFEGHPTHLATLYGKRLAVAQELERGAKWDVARVKELTGGDRITARGMRENEYTFTPSHTIIMASNHRPSVGEGERAFWARYREVPFPVSFEGREDTTLASRIIDNELDGVFQWMLKGLSSYLFEGLGYPDAVRAATSEARSESDPILDYVGHRLLITGDPNDVLPTSDVYDDWSRWATTERDGVKVGGRNHFGRFISAAVPSISAGRANVGDKRNVSVLEGVRWSTSDDESGGNTSSSGDGSGDPPTPAHPVSPAQTEIEEMEEVISGNNSDMGETTNKIVNSSVSTCTEVNKETSSATSAESRAKVTQSVRHLPAETFEPMSGDEFSEWWTSPDRDGAWSELVPA